MIDIHHHCLPGVDDGPDTWDDAVAQCRLAAAEGIDTIIATPHVLRGRWQNTSKNELALRLEKLRSLVGDTPQLILGSEYFFAHDIAEMLRTGEAIVPLAGSRYVLIEFASHTIPPLVEQPLYRVQLDGWIPVIAHPERNVVFQAKPDLLASLVALGAKTQVTNGSFTGEFGSDAKRAAESLLARGMVHFVATDAHDLKRRAPRARDAVARITELAGERVAEALTVGNPRSILDNRSLEFEPEIVQTRPPSGFLNKLKGFFTPS